MSLVGYLGSDDEEDEEVQVLMPNSSAAPSSVSRVDELPDLPLGDDTENVYELLQRSKVLAASLSSKTSGKSETAANVDASSKSPPATSAAVIVQTLANKASGAPSAAIPATSHAQAPENKAVSTQSPVNEGQSQPSNQPPKKMSLAEAILAAQQAQLKQLEDLQQAGGKPTKERVLEASDEASVEKPTSPRDAAAVVKDEGAEAEQPFDALPDDFLDAYHDLEADLPADFFDSDQPSTELQFVESKAAATGPTTTSSGSKSHGTIPGALPGTEHLPIRLQILLKENRKLYREWSKTKDLRALKAVLGEAAGADEQDGDDGDDASLLEKKVNVVEVSQFDLTRMTKEEAEQARYEAVMRGKPVTKLAVKMYNPNAQADVVVETGDRAAKRKHMISDLAARALAMQERLNMTKRPRR